MSEINIRAYKERDEEKIVPLLEQVFKGWPRFDLPCEPLDHWKWKYLGQPVKVYEIEVAEADDHIVGCNHAIYNKASLAKKEWLSRQGCDLAVHPNYRGRGIYRNMGEFRDTLRAASGADFGYFGTDNPTVIKHNIEEGRLKFPQKISNLVRIQDLDLHIEKRPIDRPWIKKLGYIIMDSINRLFTQKKHVNRSYQLVQVNEFDESIDIFYDQVRKGYKFIVCKTRDYMNWRFCDPRAGNFIVKLAMEKESIQGYSVLRINKYQKDYPIGYIVDLMALSGRNDVIDVLVQDAIDFFDKQKLNCIMAITVKGDKIYQSMINNGFVDAGLGSEIFFRMYKPERDASFYEKQLIKAKPSEIHFTFSDTDWI